MPIETIKDLQDHVRWAIQVEHSTIPPYLYAYYSLKSATSPVAQLIRSVVIEEMLHVGQACNLLNAVGESPDLADPAFLPTYPGPLPHHSPDPSLIIHLAPSSVDLIANTFLRIEKPETVGDVPETDNYQTLGQFYAAIHDGFIKLAAASPALFSGDPALQVIQLYVSGPLGQLTPVSDLPSALNGIAEIVDQGEGTTQTEFTSPDEHELAHYWKFNEIVDGTIPLEPTDVYPLVPDPRLADLPPGPVHDLARLFNDCYGLLLRTFTKVFRTGNDSPYVQKGVTFALMSFVLTPIAQLLAQTPIHGTSWHAGPSFEYSTATQQQITDDCRALITSFPLLEAVYEELTSLPTIDTV